MTVKRCMIIGLCLIMTAVGILAACAAPAQTPTQTSTPTLTPTTTPTGALAQVIAGAKKEGTVSVILKSNILPTGITHLEREIKERFGVDLQIKNTPSGDMGKDLATAIMEYKAGAAPTYDLHTFSRHVVDGNAAGVLEKVDWKPLLLEGTNPEAVMTLPAYLGAIINYTGYIGLMYNPDKVPADAVPKTLSDLANPKWKSKVGIFTDRGAWARWAFILGKDKVLADLRTLMKNNAMVGRYQDMSNRYLLTELWICLTSSVYLKEALDKGVPAVFQGVEFADAREYFLVMRKGALHPNAAKLVAIYLASPAGAKFMLEEGGGGNLYYPGNFEHDIQAQLQKLGIPEIFPSRSPDVTTFELTDEYQKWQNEIDLILKMGG